MYVSISEQSFEMPPRKKANLDELFEEMFKQELPEPKADLEDTPSALVFFCIQLLQPLKATLPGPVANLVSLLFAPLPSPSPGRPCASTEPL